MRYVAINTAAPIIEIVAVYDGKSEYTRLEKVMAAEQLLPQLDKMLDGMGLTASNFDSFVCVVGPGSFTGIRIGINTVRALAYALGKTAYGVTYDRIMAYNNSGAVVTFIDGGTGVCYVAAYEGEKEILTPTCIYKKNVHELLEMFSDAKAVADFDLTIASRFEPSQKALMGAAEYAIQNQLGTDAVYIRKPQPDRKENDI
ncbi:MAG: tRNA (adenosine(37)-N6)-threonylcarbamoyltransferase complex dimerization subunit type 1 TsaB [Clostridiales bacterium]|nr:tRNA (adenosine(37)-N6)-threonylcarbamoyltransferase complex dimerization subunit type 1 TsaB [Clostridiales bacterium]